MSDIDQAKIVIMRELMKREWKIYGYRPDESDSMTDYWSPERWSGIAEKNSYILVVHCQKYDVEYRSGKEDYSARKYTKSETRFSERDQRLIKALKEVTQERGASAEEERSALEKLDAIYMKAGQHESEIQKIYFPKFQANPGRCSWHVERDGKIVIKGTGIAKFSDLMYENRESDSFVAKDVCQPDYRRERAEKRLTLWQNLDKFINRIDTAAGAIIGNSDYEYKTVMEIKYKHKNVIVERESGTVEEGATFVVRGWLNYNRNRGNVYRIHKHEGYWTATLMNSALTKERTGYTRGIEFGYYSTEQLEKLLARGIIVWCDIQDKPEPYEIEKIVKRKKKTA